MTMTRNEAVLSETTTSCCPSCGHGNLTVFHEVDDVPAHSCLLMPSRDEAIAYPRGNIRLALCSQCGMITNVCFDPSLHEYSPRYEETQHFSARFRQFAEDLANRLIDTYDLRDKDILEIGCGKGEFLATLCRMGDNRGVGIDPGIIPERIASTESPQVRFIQDFYGENYSHLTGDLICCRHTLEHIQPVREFVKTIRRSLDNRRDTLVFFEVPDVTRVLRESAFWDIYYEHCSYFSLDSLTRLFHACRFQVLEAWRDFDGQYLCLMARPCTGAVSADTDLEQRLIDLCRDVETFRTECDTAMQQWKRRIELWAAEGRRPVAWGGGSKCVALLTTLHLDNAIEYVVDINPHKQGEYVPGTGQQVVAPEFLQKYCPRTVIAMNPIYRREIDRCLEQLGVEADVVAV